MNKCRTMEAKLIGRKNFSNKRFRIDIDLYEEGMARVKIINKKLIHRPFICRNYLCFDECRTESMYDLTDLLPSLNSCKVSRRWFRRIMQHCTNGYTTNDGRFDFKKVREDENKRFHQTEVMMKLNAGHLKVLKEFLPDVFKYGFRTIYTYSLSLQTDPLRPNFDRMSENGRRIFMRKYSKRPPIYKIENDVLLKMLEHLDFAFYNKLVQERTLDDCKIEMWYHWRSNEYPNLWITVSDKTYSYFVIPR